VKNAEHPYSEVESK